MSLMNEFDPYQALIESCWETVRHALKQCADPYPILEFNVESGHLGVYPADDYINAMAPENQMNARVTYVTACAQREFMIFVRDPDNESLRSYTYGIDYNHDG